MRQYTSKNYPVWCFVPPEIYKIYCEQSWRFTDADLIFAIDKITFFYGKKLLLNNWKEGGKFDERGFRIPSTKTGTAYSPHKMAKAQDFNVPGVAPQEVQKELIENCELWPEITRMEDIKYTTGWTHVDTCNMTIEKNGIYIFKP